MKRLPARSRALTLIELAERIAATIAASMVRSRAQASPPPPVSWNRWPPTLSEIVAEAASVRDSRTWSCPRRLRFGQVPTLANGAWSRSC